MKVKKFPNFLIVNQQIFCLVYHRDVRLYCVKIYLPQKKHRLVFFYTPHNIFPDPSLFLKKSKKLYCHLPQSHDDIALMDNWHYIWPKTKEKSNSNEKFR